MRWTAWAGSVVGLLGLTGCYYGFHRAMYEGRYSAASRPDASYYCYDCHGYRYFDPYYNWCARYGFRYGWADHPQVVHLYRERYVSIREQHPEYGRYRYKPGYKSSTRYREEQDYDSWKSGRSGSTGRQPAAGRKPGKSSSTESEKAREKPRERKEPGGSKEPRSDRGGSRS